MKKIETICILLFLISSSFFIIKAETTQSQTRIIADVNTECLLNEIREVIHFSEPKLLENEYQNSITLKEADTYVNNPGQPVIPIITKTYILPIGTIISQVSCFPQGVQEKIVEQELCLASKPLSLSNSKAFAKTHTENFFYNSDAFYPSTWFKYNIGVGLNGTEHVTYLTLRLYPIRYAPEKDLMNYANSMEINIHYETVETPIVFPDAYDLVIISPFQFSSYIQPLITHKETMNIKTKLVTTEDIYHEYEGRDQQEKIKYFIKHAVEEWGATYVLIFGGMNGQNIFSWHVPIRYSHLNDGGESKYISDVYYSDLYKYDNTTGFTFDDWDSNENNIFAEWYAFISSKKPYTRTIVDILDMYPDVYIGRLPCRNSREVKNMVDKIINYEVSSYGKEWFKKMVVLGGDTANESLWVSNATDYYEGEMMTSSALSFMDGYRHIRLWPDGGDVELTATNAEDILSEGEGFVYFAGHGDPFAWLTHPHGKEDEWITFSQKNIKNLINDDKLPLMIVSGCHNCQFDTSLLRFITDGIQAFAEYLYVQKCWGWQFTCLPKGGSIASIGHTGTSYYGAGDGHLFENNIPDGIPDCIQYFDGWLEPHFFKIYNHDGIDILGQTHGQALTDYLNQFPIDWNTKLGDRETQMTIYDCKTVQEWVLFGDPSLKIGGYPKLKENEIL